MNEPLKGKIAYATAVYSKDIADRYAKKGKKEGLVMSQVFMKDWVEDAVEWLKKELHKNTDAKSRTSLFQVSDIIKLIDEAFPDLCPTEDIIAVKKQTAVMDNI